VCGGCGGGAGAFFYAHCVLLFAHFSTARCFNNTALPKNRSAKKNSKKTKPKQEFNPETGEWADLPAGMTARGDCEAAAVPAGGGNAGRNAGTIMVMGGWGPDDFSNLVELYDPKKRAFARAANMTVPRGALFEGGGWMVD
jgi:hypothetical protein